MNRILFNLKNIAMVAVFTLVAFIGYNAVRAANGESEKKVTDTNFTFNEGSVTNADNYITEPPIACDGEETICVILAPDSSGHPQMDALVPGITPSETVQQRILAALNAPGGPQTNETVISLRAKK